MGLAAAAFLLCVAGLASAGPDLVVANADVDIDVRSPTQGNTVTLEAVVHNNGNAAAGAFSVRFTLDSSATLATVAVSGLAAGATANVTASWDVGSTSLGAHSVQAIADSGSAVAEDSEANNQGSYAFSVNDAPSAAAAVNNTPLSTLVPFGFSSTGSTDTDGSIVSYLWLFDDGTVSNDADPSHQYADGGAGGGKAYTVTLIVTDNDGGTDSATVPIHVLNRAPVASAADVTGNTMTSLAFSGTSSVDLDGRIVNATWAFSDGMTLYGLTVLRSFADNGAFSATLTVRDEDGATDAAGIAITINNQPPTPVIATNPVMPFQPSQNALFDGRNSFDVDGGIANYTWVFPGGVYGYGSTATHSFAANGTYNVTLVLVDDDGVIGQLTIAALVGNDTIGTRVPTPPVGRIALSALTVFTGEPVTLDASNSTDDTGIISYLWDFADGATGVGVLVSHAWATDGNYLVTLNVTDTDGNSSFAMVTVHVKDRPPVAAILASPTTTQTLTAVAFDGGSSSDSDGTILFYRWSFGDATVLYGRSVQHTYTRAGVYAVTLTVTDNDGVDDTASTTITITNRPPTAVVPANFQVPTFEERLFDGSGSHDLDGVLQTYRWTFGDGTNATGRQVKHQFATIGTFTVRLDVFDDLGAMGSANMTVTVLNNRPQASISGPLSILTGETANFQGTGIDRDGNIATWLWDFGASQGTATSANTASHLYPAKGTFTVTLTVTDDQGSTGTASYVLQVLNRVPTAKITSPNPGTVADSLQAVQFSATGAGGSSDPETPSALEYFWIFGDGGVAEGATVSHPFSQAGTFTVILTVSDPDGGAASATVGVVIRNQAPVARPGANVTSALTLETVRFDGGASSDPDGLVQSWLWDFGDGLTSALRSPDHVFQTAPSTGSVFTVRLTVYDNLGASHSATMDLTVQNRAPVGVIENGEPLYASLTAFFRATKSTDADGVVTTYEWAFGDGGTESGAQTSHVYAGAGTFTVTLTVTDNRGGSSVVTKEVHVQVKPTYNTGGGGNVTAPATPGFESAGAVAAVGAAAALAVVSRRRRQA